MPQHVVLADKKIIRDLRSGRFLAENGQDRIPFVVFSLCPKRNPEKNPDGSLVKLFMPVRVEELTQRLSEGSEKAGNIYEGRLLDDDRTWGLRPYVPPKIA